MEVLYYYKRFVNFNEIGRRSTDRAARAAQTTTNQPTGHQLSRQGLHMPRKAYFGAK